jgi:hypothetical protein
MTEEMVTMKWAIEYADQNYKEGLDKGIRQTKEDLHSKVIDFMQGQYIVKTGDKYRLTHDDLLNLNALFGEEK